MVERISRVIALSPGGMSATGFVVAAARAGSLGVLDFAVGCDGDRLTEAAAAVSGYLDGQEYGVRLAASGLDGGLLRRLPANLKVVIVTHVDEGVEWCALAKFVRDTGRAVFAEVTSRDSARLADGAGCDAVIVAGHEAGGHGADESSFIFLQAALASTSVPIYVRGGIGPRAAAACMAAGASGVVLDGALLLARESPLAQYARDRIERLDGGETVVVGRTTRSAWRGYARPGSPALARLKEAEAEGPDAWTLALGREVGWDHDHVWPVGQDAAFAAALARRFVTVGGMVQAVERAIDEGIRLANSNAALASGSPLAVSHGTRYPIVQGPMTRVSDTPAFADAVARGGAMPFLALALMRGAEVRALLAEAATKLQGRPWGVGILGFVPPELRREQEAEIRNARPPFALIAGGRPDQARSLEREGIATYLHVPSPGLLRQFLADGARRFVLEGRECGGHVGPRSSFVLWEQAADVAVEAIEGGIPGDEIHLLFAGGIHDARSAAAVAAFAAPLAARGVRIGVLVGTAYLFTAEAVTTGAIVPAFQAEAIRCARTVLLETGPGHEVRVSPTPFTNTFEVERARLLRERRPTDEVRTVLEGLNAGRLRVASKGLERSNGTASPLVSLDETQQGERGLYMLGQAAILRDRVLTIDELHDDIAEGNAHYLQRAAAALPSNRTNARSAPSDIAIVGMAAIVPGAGDVRTFWENTLGGIDSIVEVPADRWDWRLYYDPDPKAPDKVTSKWGGFVPDVPFDPLRYGMPPTSLPSIEPVHLLTLEVVRAALDDAGYARRPFPRERTAVVLGAGGGAAQLAMGYAFRSYLPMLDTVAPGAGTEALARCGAALPEWTEDSFPGILLNVAAGRVANRFDLGGANYTVDAACGSSLAAAAVAVRELESGAADVVILGGADTVQNPFTYLAFSKTHAFSPRGRCRPFDASADGIVISEGVAAVVLKRLADAERDGDRIYAVIKGLGASSDGRAKGLTAPRPEGQVLAIERAYQKAGVAPATVGYVEAHGTGTAAGDLSEIQSLTGVFTAAGAEPQSCAVGSVKSLIGHTKCAAGLAGLINATLALYHKVLPPTIGVESLNPRANIAEGPFRISTATRPWLHAAREHPRRAGVSAFGFGGTNFHAVLEAYERDPSPSTAPVRNWPAELLVWRAADRARLEAQLQVLGRALETGARPPLVDLAHHLAVSANQDCGGPILAIVASSLDDLREKLRTARERLSDGSTSFHDPRGIDFAERPQRNARATAFLFPGQGAQYPDMLADLAVAFADVRRAFESIDATLVEQGRRPVGPYVFPPPAFTDEDRTRHKDALAATEVAQPALAAASTGLSQLLESLGVRPDMVAGHSFGELVALHAGGSFSLEKLAILAESRGQLIRAAAGQHPGAMAALSTGGETIAKLLDGLDNVLPVNWNGPKQTVISGTSASVEAAVARAREQGIRAQLLPVACAFHSPIVARASEPLAELAARLGTVDPRLPVFSNVSAAPYRPGTVAPQLGAHLAQPVRFAEMIEAMHADGARVFVEVGPGSTLTSLVGSILGTKPHLAVALDPPARGGVRGLLLALSRLIVTGLPVRLERLTADRRPRSLDPERFTCEADAESLAPSTWLVNGGRARPAFGPEPPRLGTGPALPILEPATRRAEPSRNGHHAPDAQQSNDSPHPDLIPLPEMSVPVAGSDRVLEAYQASMRRFLDVQRETMLAYLSGAGSPAADHAPALGGPNGHLAPPTASSKVPPQEPAAAFSAAPINKPAPDPRVPAQEPGARAADHAAPHRGPESTAGRPTTRAAWEKRLLEIVRERTGYPAEMLRLDLDLEADLGIDSIKRVEILGSLRDDLPGATGFDSETMEQLARAKTLGAIVDHVLRAIGLPAAAAGGAGAVNGAAHRNGVADGREPSAGSPVPHAVSRRQLQVVSAPIPAPRVDPFLQAGGVLLVTDDRRGIARLLSRDLRARGISVVRVRDGASDRAESAIDLEFADLSSPYEVDALLRRVRSRGVIRGIVHALPLRDQTTAGLNPVEWRARIGSEVRGLFLLARAAAPDLESAAEQGGACLIATTALGGAFASAGTAPADFFPGHGAVAGLVKTLAHEWPAVHTRVVDFDPAGPIEVIAANLVQEVFANDGLTEVGYFERRRVSLKSVEVPIDRAGRDQLALAPGAPVLVTGGARGITAVVAAELARRWRPTLLLIGTSPVPDHEEAPATRGVADPSALKSALWQLLAQRGRAVGPADLDRAYHALRREREIRDNLRNLRAEGATVVYAQADVRDAGAVGSLLDDWRARFGPIAGLIHGAGVIRDKLLRDKTPDSFDQVVGTKLEGALVLANLLDHDPLQFAAFFSSVAGRFGNRGQSDYAAANEALNKLALWLDRRWRGRVVSLGWGPWSGVGMVSDLEPHLGRRGLGMIPPEVGGRALADELRLGLKVDVEVIVAGDLGPLDNFVERQVARPRGNATRHELLKE